MLDYVKQQNPHVNLYPDNCAARVNGALNAGGIQLKTPVSTEFGTVDWPVDNFPFQIATGLFYSTVNIAIEIPKGSTLPRKFLTGFNPAK